MSWAKLGISAVLEVARYLNKPEAEKWAKDVLELERERIDEENKPAWEERDVYPDLRARDFRDDARLISIDDELFVLGKAITTASRAQARL